MAAPSVIASAAPPAKSPEQKYQPIRRRSGQSLSATSNAWEQDGVTVEILTEGEGPAIRIGDSATLYYTLTLEDGKVIDSSQSGAREPFSFVLGSGVVIRGFERGVVGMKRRETRLIVVPPDLGYGSVARSDIPANSVLVFRVTLIEFRAPS